MIQTNNLVWFKLTDAGEAILADYVACWNRECPENPLNKKQFRGKNWHYLMALHEAMRIF